MPELQSERRFVLSPLEWTLLVVAIILGVFKIDPIGNFTVKLLGKALQGFVTTFVVAITWMITMMFSK
jgi:hypothetical protein